MPTIRVATPKDLKKAQYICIKTASAALQKNEKTARITAALFADYYIQNESRNCFVLCDDSDEVVGYILSSTDIKSFCKAYRTDILRNVVKLSPLWGFVCLFVPVKYYVCRRKYPAHLHIDILPDFQSAGYGSKMMNALLSHLKEQKISGVMLSCSANNTRAVHFYKKHGFHTMLKVFNAQVMGLKIQV